MAYDGNIHSVAYSTKLDGLCFSFISTVDLDNGTLVSRGDLETGEREIYKAEIDKVVKSYSAQLETNPDFLLYRTKIDYSKTCEQIEQDMLVILGKQAAKATANFSANSSAIWGARTNVPAEGKANGRYGDLFSNFED